MNESKQEKTSHILKAAQLLREAAQNPSEQQLMEMASLLIDTAREADDTVQSSSEWVSDWIASSSDEPSKDAAITNIANLLQIRASEFAGVQACFSALSAVHQAKQGARREWIALGASAAAVVVAAASVFVSLMAK